ncbi:hypothetical protein ABLE91_05590 [Aquabacter sp. CN5-332]|uniref:hypothetical protein n=1 Tax=Aquabacter sp. CN5-332 TaxID=3156608 RepID=UPI0032B58DCD
MSAEAKSAPAPRVVDNDLDEITVMLGGEELRGWGYNSEAQRREKMTAAREFCEGWHAAAEHHIHSAALTSGSDHRQIAAPPALHEAMAPFASMPDDPGRPDDAMTGMRISYGELRRAKAALALSEGRTA